MATIRVLNSKNVQGVLIVAETATATVTAAANEAFAAAAVALNAAGEVATLETVVPGVLATVRAELGGNYTPRGPWLPEGVYRRNDLVSFFVGGTARLFVARLDVPEGVVLSDITYWAELDSGSETDPADPQPTEPQPGDTPSLTLTLSETELTLIPGASAGAQLEALFFSAAASEPTWVVASDEPGLSGTVSRLETPTDPDEPHDEALPEEAAAGSLYNLTVTAAAQTPVGRYAVRVAATTADGLSAETQLEAVVAQAAATLESPTAVYGMSGAAGYTLAAFARDSGPNALHLTRGGNVRPSADGGGWLSEGGFGAVLQTPPLTGQSMTGPNELTSIVPDTAGLADGAVVAALASTTQRNDWVCALKTAAGLKLRVSAQTASGIVTRDSDVIPHGGGLTISTDPTAVGLHNLGTGASATLPRPAWAAGGVVGAWFAVPRADGSVLSASAGGVLTATPHAVVLTGEARARNAQVLTGMHTGSGVAPTPEHPTGTRLIALMQPGEATRDRTFYDPATHDLRLLGDAAAGAAGGIVTTGAAGSGARTDWLPDLTWDAGFVVGYLADGFFDLPLAACQLALACRNSSEAWVRLRPEIVGGDYRLIAETRHPNGAKHVLSIGNRRRHFFVVRYNVAKRYLFVREVYSNVTTGTLSIPAAYSGPAGISLGTAYRGKTASGTDLGATEASATRSGGLWLGLAPFTTEQEEVMVAALGSGASAIPAAPAPPPDPNPDPNPPPGGAAAPLVGDPDFSAASLGSGGLRRVYDELAAPGWLYLPNNRRENPVGVANGWEKRFDPTPANEGTVWRWDSYNGIRYRRYIGVPRGSHVIGRGMAQLSETVTSQAFRATRDLRLLDLGCSDLDALYDAARDESGIGTNQPDGYLGFAAGTDGKNRLFYGPDDPRNTAAVTTIDGVKKPYFMNDGGGNQGLKGYTGLEIPLEEGIMVFWMVTALAAHRNQDKFSPTFEPVGNRPATPQYYRRIRDRAIKLYLDTCRKWDDFFRARNDRKQELPLHVRRSLLHSWLCELGAKAAYAMILHGDAWEASAEGREAARAWRMTFGQSEKVGVQPKVNLATWHEAVHPKYGKCVFWVHDLRRVYPSATKDATGEYVSYKTVQNGVHPNNYCGHDYGVMSFLHEEGASFVTREWMEKCVNTVLATCDLGISFNRISTASSPTPIPYTQNGGNQVPSLVSPWGGIKSTLGAADSFLVNSAAPSLCAYDTHGGLEPLVRRHYARYGGPQTWGATSGLLLAAAKREGRI